ncbi:MAG: sulfotransferase family 2 domain-containing protein [Cyanobacteria bacterium P01_F01_bin.143]
MEPLAKNNLLLFAHIPKTAGMTLWTIIKQNYPGDDSYYYDIGLDLAKAARRITRSPDINIAMGHFGFGFHHFFKQPYVYLTMLREPVERTISDYYYYQQSEMAINQYNPPLTWQKFCTRMANNTMTRFYSGLEFAYMKHFQSFDRLRTAKIQNHPVLKDYYNSSSSELLELAKNNLKQHFEYIGIVERFDESLILLRRKFGWKHLNYINRNIGNKKPKRLNFSSQDIDCIMQYNQLDIELYNYAQKLFEQQIKIQDKSFDQEVTTLQKHNKRYSKLINSTEVQAKLLKNLPVGL